MHTKWYPGYTRLSLSRGKLLPGTPTHTHQGGNGVPGHTPLWWLPHGSPASNCLPPRTTSAAGKQQARPDDWLESEEVAGRRDKSPRAQLNPQRSGQLLRCVLVQTHSKWSLPGPSGLSSPESANFEFVLQIRGIARGE